MWVDKNDIFPIPCYLASSDLWWLNQMKISLHGYIVTFDLTVLILLSPSWLSIFYKFVLLSFLFSCYPRIFNFCPIPASLAKINTPAAWKLWIPLFWIHFCHLWSTIHLLSYLWVWSFRIFFLRILPDFSRGYVSSFFRLFVAVLSALCSHSARAPFSKSLFYSLFL